MQVAQAGACHGVRMDDAVKRSYRFEILLTLLALYGARAPSIEAADGLQFLGSSDLLRTNKQPKERFG